MARARLLRVGGRMGLSNADRDDLYRDARALAHRSDDKELLAALMWSYGASYYMSGQLRDARPHIAASVRLADEIGNAGFSSAFRVGSGVVALVMGPLSAALEEMQTSIDVTDGDPSVGTAFLGYSPLVRSTINRSMAHTLMGHLDEARADAEWGLAAARENGELENVVIGLCAMNLWAFHAGVEDGCLARARESLQLAEMSTRYLHTYAWEGMGMACLLAHRPNDAIGALEGGVAVIAEGAGGFQQASVLALLSAAHAAAGDARRALEVATEAVEFARVRGARVFEGPALIRRAHAHRLLGHDEMLIAEDERLARLAIEETGAFGYAPFLDNAPP
jgi:hypothetical protein